MHDAVNFRAVGIIPRAYLGRALQALRRYLWAAATSRAAQLVWRRPGTIMDALASMLGNRQQYVQHSFQRGLREIAELKQKSATGAAPYHRAVWQFAREQLGRIDVQRGCKTLDHGKAAAGRAVFDLS